MYPFSVSLVKTEAQLLFTSRPPVCSGHLSKDVGLVVFDHRMIV